MSEWDKQNKRDEEKKLNKKSSGGAAHKAGKSANGGGSAKYRDRAFERRKQGFGTEIEINAASLDIEQSKHLGGDMEHTHLVKGLDFTLLQKMRQEPGDKAASGPPGMPIGLGPPGMPATFVASSFSSTTASMSTLARKAKRDQELREAEADRNTLPITEMGKALKQMLNLKREGAGGGGSTLQRTQYEFALHDGPDGDATCDSDLPTIINRAKSEIQIDEAVASCAILPDVLARLVETFKAMLGGKKRKRDGDRKKDSAATALGTAGTMSMGFFDPGIDIFADVGKYVPVGALDAEEIERERERANAVVTSSSSVAWAVSSTKDLFNNGGGVNIAVETHVEEASTLAKLDIINAAVSEETQRMERKTQELEKKASRGEAVSDYDYFPENVGFEDLGGGSDDEEEAAKKKSREKLGVKK